MVFPRGTEVKNLPTDAGGARVWARSLGREDPLEEEMATDSSTLAWEFLHVCVRVHTHTPTHPQEVREEAPDLVLGGKERFPGGDDT